MLEAFYRRHTENFALIAKPLYSLLKTSNKFDWTAECDLAVAKLQSLIDQCLLQRPDFDKVFILSTDSSKHTIAGALTQPNETADDDAIGFFSRVLRGPEINYSVIEKEFLAVLDSVLYFRCYLIGAKFKTKIITDHRPLKFILNLKISSSRLIRWAIKLEEFNFEIIYRPGKINFVADALSRIEPPMDFITESIANINMLTRAQARMQQTNDKAILVPTPDVLLDSPNVSISQDSQEIVQENEISDNESLDSLVVQPSNSPNQEIDLLPETQETSDQSPLSYEVDQNRFSKPNVNISDEAEILEIIKLHHDSAIGAHFGVNKTVAKIRQYYDWHGMVTDIRAYIKACPICQKNKSQGATRAPMVIVSTAKHSFEKIAIDLVGPLPVTDRYNRYVLTVQDSLTKWIMAIPLPNQESDTVARALVEKVFLIFGSPEGLLSDQGANFMSKLIVSICKFFKIHKVQCSAYHPESNGGLERSHFFLKNYLRAFTNKQQTDWDLWCKFAAFSYNTTPHTATKISPFELLFGRKANLPSVIFKKPEPLYNYDNYLCELKYRLQNANKIAMESLRLAKIRSKEIYDRTAKQSSYNVQDKVLLKANHSKIGRPLFEKWIGPFTVMEVPSPEGVIIKVGNKLKRFHNNLVKPYNS